jgi:hypothetical protein
VQAPYCCHWKRVVDPRVGSRCSFTPKIGENKRAMKRRSTLQCKRTSRKLGVTDFSFDLQEKMARLRKLYSKVRVDATCNGLRFPSPK